MTNVNKGGISFEKGLGYRVSINTRGYRVRSQRLKSLTAAKRMLRTLQNVVSNGSFNSIRIMEADGLVSLTRRS